MENDKMDNDRSRLHSRVAEIKAELAGLQRELDAYPEGGLTSSAAESAVPDGTAQRTAAPLKREDRFQGLANNLNVGIYRNTSGPEGRCIAANSAIVDMFGFDSKEEFFNSPVVDLYQNSDDRRKFSEKMKKEGFVVNEELQVKKKRRHHFHRFGFHRGRQR